MSAGGLGVELQCSVCLSVYTDPVTLSCGHNFCLLCISEHWDNQKHREYSCPECRERFKRRPELRRNLRLCSIAEHFVSASPRQPDNAILCAYCKSPVPAVKTIPPADTQPRVRSRSVDQVPAKPGSGKCSVHKELVEYSCSRYAACSCVYCRLDREQK
ncbi:E3 ubiquitin/ISG15 ligase TRIM25-like [Spea bombifrons]|uniref:E3 ubiquitin/ISG15 ligase TRIM25-like n=1 Tax=Spea bombifrons TaxID=233779 RepID=UPI002349F31B|nr:E3 ubiquitin/ISG15 ligase TRIM25-like [Spea bombifrons]